MSGNRAGENTGDGPMVLMGTRTGPNSANKHINYDTKEDMRAFNEKNKRGAYGGHVKPAADKVDS